MPANRTSNPTPNSHQPSPVSGSLKWKMFTLIGMLVMVIYSMNEAGKPENWAWMGFEKKSKSNKSENLNDAPIATGRVAAKGDSTSNSANSKPEANSSNASTSATEPGSANPTKPNQPPSVRSAPIRLSKSSASFPHAPQPTALPTESARFWSSFFASLNTAEQIQWMDLLEASQSSLPPAERPPATKTQAMLVARAARQRDDFDNKLRDRMSSIPHASEKRSQVSQRYFEADKLWQNRILPALTAAIEAQELTLIQQQATVNLQHHLDIDALNLVQDKTAVGWTGDSVAWKRAWKRIHESKVGEPAFVKRIQLIGQPREFRGKAVTVYGFVRAIETRTESSDSSIAGPQADGTDEVTYYIVWVQPSGSTAGPYCVYCLNLPAGLPRSRDELAKFEQMATVHGIFFKNRTYQLADRTVDYSPLILTDGFELKPSLNFSLSPTWMAAALALVPLLGVGIVWYAFRSTVSRKRLPSKKKQEEINVFLGDLKDDPSIKTELEQVQAIAEHEDDIS